MELLEWMESNKKQHKRKLTEMRYFDLCFVAGICFLSLIIGIIYVLLSKTVYFWDDATYWDISRMLTRKPINLEFFKEVYNSIGTSDYNYFVAVPQAIWGKLFGVTRISYIVSVIIFYVIPTEIVLFLFAKRMSKAPRFAYAITIMAIPAFLYIAIIGFIDVVGVLIGLICYYLYFTNVSDKASMLKSIILGILLVLIMVSRRYFAFFSVSFLTLITIDTILYRRDIKQFVITIITVGLVLGIGFYPFLRNILLKDYGTLYSSYKYSVLTDLKLITRYFGTVFLILLFATVPLGIIKKKDLRGAFALLQILVCAAMFMSTQTHGQQHLLLYMPALFVLIILSVNYIDSRKMLLLVCAIAVLNCFSPVIPRKQPENIREIKSLAAFPSYSIKPEKRSDINDLLTIKRTLDKKIPNGEKCGVVASSFVINSSILTNVVPSLNMKENREDTYIIGLPEVDSRDFWRLNEMYECDYLLVANPAQTHLSPNEQTIVTEAVKSFQDNTDIAKSFSRVTDFKADIDGIEVLLYKRIKTVSETEKTEFQLKLYK